MQSLPVYAIYYKKKQNLVDLLLINEELFRGFEVCDFNRLVVGRTWKYPRPKCEVFQDRHSVSQFSSSVY